MSRRNAGERTRQRAPDNARHTDLTKMSSARQPALRRYLADDGTLTAMDGIRDTMAHPRRTATRCRPRGSAWKAYRLARAAGALAAVASVTACGSRRGFTRYEPVPLPPLEGRAEAFATRRLTDPRLDTLLVLAGATRASHVVPAPVAVEAGRTTADDTVPPRAWRSRDLGLVAVFFNPELDTARAGVQAVRAGILTARQRPQPSVGTSVGNAGPTGTGPVPFAAALTTGFTIETGGKRPARIDRAQAAVLATELRLRALGWRVAFDAQDAAERARSADLTALDARTEREQLAVVLGLLRARYAEGATSAADIARTASDLQAAAVAVVEAARTQADARDSLARTLGVSVDETRTIRIRPDAPPADALPADGPPASDVRAFRPSVCAALDTLSPPRLRTVALQRRYDLGAALGEYTLAEADVRVEVTRQYPDVAIGPGLAFDGGALQWTIGAGLPNLLLNRNRGPIAEAQARRVAAATRVEQVQQQVLRDLAAARFECEGAAGQVAAADSLARAADRAAALAASAYNRGEIGRTEVALARLTAFRASRARRTAQQRAELATVLLERAVGGWLSGPTLPDAVLLRDLRALGTAGTAGPRALRPS